MKFHTKEEAGWDKCRVKSPGWGHFQKRGFGGNRQVQPHILLKSPLPIWPFTHYKAWGQYYNHHKDAKIRNTQEGSYMLVQKNKKEKNSIRSLWSFSEEIFIDMRCPPNTLTNFSKWFLLEQMKGDNGWWGHLRPYCSYGMAKLPSTHV